MSDHRGYWFIKQDIDLLMDEFTTAYTLWHIDRMRQYLAAHDIKPISQADADVFEAYARHFISRLAALLKEAESSLTTGISELIADAHATNKKEPKHGPIPPSY